LLLPMWHLRFRSAWRPGAACAGGALGDCKVAVLEQIGLPQDGLLSTASLASAGATTTTRTSCRCRKRF
jgi:hypothetical protein